MYINGIKSIAVNCDDLVPLPVLEHPPLQLLLQPPLLPLGQAHLQRCEHSVLLRNLHQQLGQPIHTQIRVGDVHDHLVEALKHIPLILQCLQEYFLIFYALHFVNLGHSEVVFVHRVALVDGCAFLLDPVDYRQYLCLLGRFFLPLDYVVQPIQPHPHFPSSNDLLNLFYLHLEVVLLLFPCYLAIAFQ